jgi:aspartate/methionine/tyrosine aminotransferase
VCAPSFLDIAEPGERLISTNSFSKAWLMTGWRLGWLVAPESLLPQFAKLIEYNTSCAPGFVQCAGVVAVRDGEPVVAHTRERFRHARDLLLAELATIPSVTAAVPAGAMYAFFRIAGVTDSLAFCKALVHEAKLGLAPGIAFGPEGEGYFRWCFAAADARLHEGLERLRNYLKKSLAASSR